METEDPPLVDGGWASKLVAATLQVGCCLLHATLIKMLSGGQACVMQVDICWVGKWAAPHAVKAPLQLLI